MMKDSIIKQTQFTTKRSLHERFLPRAIEKSKTTEVIMVYVISMEKPEPRRGLDIKDLLRNSLNKCHGLQRSQNHEATRSYSTPPWTRLSRGRGTSL